MSVTLTPVTANTTRWTVTTLTNHLLGELNLDRNAAGGSVPDRAKDIVRRCCTDLWDYYDWRHRIRKLDLGIWETETGTCTGAAYSGTTTVLTANTGTFYASMVNHSIVITGVGTFAVASYTSATSITVTGDASTASASAWTVTATGRYTLPAWVAKIDQRWLEDSAKSSSTPIRVTDDPQGFQQIADQYDSTDEGEPVCMLLVRDFDESTFWWEAVITPLTDDTYTYPIWCLAKNPFLAESASDETIIAWPETFDRGWYLDARYRMLRAWGGSSDEASEAKNDFKEWIARQLAENNTTISSAAEPSSEDAYGDFRSLSSQRYGDGYPYRQGIWPS